ncbi:hypothetical protein ACFHW2_11975 [Actinomadura sp. LOL_016]|uniref:hypothetical protein n=1 Tax=unclassified Actinomadura TaxID=2626254 RepID=UPI003A7FEA12
MGNNAAHHEASLVIRLAGTHDALVEIVGTVIQVLIPGAVITITDGEAAKALFKAWVEARLIARQVMTHKGAARSYGNPRPLIHSAVRVDGPQPVPLVAGKTPSQSPSGCGQIAVRVGRFTIVCDDRAAWQTQDRVWAKMYDLAVEIWKVRYPEVHESRVAERFYRENR